ncbi:MAG TPA: hypothetical protein VEY88_24515 [Archangium sp.]|nr:hypothetical protein [Archangium sp.]
MRHNKASLWLGTLLVLAGCPQPEETPKLSAVTVTCEPASIPVGRPTQCTASAMDQNGKPFTVSGYTWTSSNESVARVGTTGRALTFTPGTTTLRASATADDITQQGEVTVTVVTEAQPTLHTTPIGANETWRVAENPHLVRGSIEVGGGANPTLTLEEGVQLRFEQDAELRVTNGALKAIGTQAVPINLTASQSPSSAKGFWRGVVFVGGGSASELTHVTLSGCGRNTGESACLALKTGAAPVLRQVTVRNSGSVGVAVADDGSAFGAGSTALSVSGGEGYPVRIGANQADTLPTGSSFTDNVSNAVELRGEVSRSQTWPNPGIPYVVTGEVLVRNADACSTLTLSAGTVLRFGTNAGLRTGGGGLGGLIVDGTAASPVLFTADSTSPQPGHWSGVYVVYFPACPSRISHATFEYGGAPVRSTEAGSLNLYAGGFNDPGSRLENVIVQKSRSTGLYLGLGGNIGPGSTGVTVRDNGGYAILAEPNSVGAIPTGISVSGNAFNTVMIREGAVFNSQTWPNRGVPYVVNGWVSVKATLTVLAGTEFRFVGANQGFLIGDDTPGALIAQGTAQAPIRFIPNTATPTKGHWSGLHFWKATGSRLDHVIVTHAGAASDYATGNVNVYRELGAFVTNSTLSSSSGCGFNRSNSDNEFSTPVTTDFTLASYNNTIADNTGGAQCTIQWPPN